MKLHVERRFKNFISQNDNTHITQTEKLGISPVFKVDA